jgi:1-acyl-sn-glycerol-3-phosphate acyltransferase
MPNDDIVEEANAPHGERGILDTLRDAAVDVRTVANRYIFGGVLSTTSAATMLLRRLLPERHPLLPDHDTIWALARVQARALAGVCGVTVAAQGVGRLEPSGPVVYVANHQSAIDIIALLGVLPGSVRFVVTEECERDRVFGPVLRLLGLITIDPARPEEAIAAIGELTRGGTSAILFPEGRRNQGQRLLPFSDQPFGVAIALGLPVVPIAIRGARAVTSAGALFGIRPGRVEVVVEEPIPTTDLLPADCHPLREDVHGTISRYVDEVEFLADDVDEETPTPLTNGTGAGDGASAW